MGAKGHLARRWQQPQARQPRPGRRGSAHRGRRPAWPGPPLSLPRGPHHAGCGPRLPPHRSSPPRSRAAQTFHNHSAIPATLGSGPSPRANPHPLSPPPPGGTQAGSGQPRPTRHRSILGGQSGPRAPRRQPIPSEHTLLWLPLPGGSPAPRVRGEGRGCGRGPTPTAALLHLPTPAAF